jgi:hypothetical protein
MLGLSYFGYNVIVFPIKIIDYYMSLRAATTKDDLRATDAVDLYFAEPFGLLERLSNNLDSLHQKEIYGSI